MKNLFTCLFNAPEAKNRSLSSQLDSLSIVSRQSDLAKYVATLTLFLCLGIGNAWGWNTTYLIGDPTGSWSKNTDYSMGNSDANSRFFYLTKNNYFAFYIDYHNYQIGPASNGNTMTTGDGGQKFSATNTSNSAKYTGNTGIVEVHVQQKDNGDNTPWVWLTRPTVYIRHKWNNSETSTVAMTDNNDGTYKYTGYYSSSSSNIWVGPENATSASNIFKYFTSSNYTKVGSPTNEDKCIFEYNASGYNSNKNSTTNKGTLTVTKLYSITYDDNDATSGSVPTGVTDRKWNVTTTIADNTGSLVKTGYVFVGWNTSADGTGTFYLPGSTFSPSAASTTLYAQWLTVHEPGLYETAALSGGYGQTLVNSGGRDYEVYQYTNSSGIYVYAGTLTTSESAANCMLKYAVSKGNAKKNWMLHSGGVYGTSSFSTHDKEFQANTYNLNVIAGNTHIIVVSGYDQFSLYGRDKTVSSEEMEIYINGTKKTLGSTSYKIGRWDLDPEDTYIIRITANGTGSNYSRDAGFSLRIPEVTCTAPTALAATSPTAKGAILTVTDAEDTNDYEFYVSTSSTAPTSGSTATHSVTSSKSKTITDLVAGTTYYAWARSKCTGAKSDWVALGSGGTFTTSTVSADYHLTNVTKTSGATSGIGGSTFTAVFAAASGYSMPDPTVTIDGNSATSGTDYTWTAGTGTLTISADKINGDIDITLNSATTAPSSVDISGSYHYYPGETISLTATATGGNGPKTYQWYKGGTDDENEIDGATSASFTKASCAVGDAGDYYCKVTCDESASTTSSVFQVKIMQLLLKNSSGVDIQSYPLTKVDATHASVILNLTGGTVYKFRVTDGCNNWYGNSDATGMTSSNSTNWTMPHDADCKMTTSGKTANYPFNFDFTDGLLGSQMKVSIVYPGGDQAADKVIYWDNSVLSWASGNQWYRIGKSTNNTKTQMTKVTGTANLYTVTTSEYNGFEYWHIANNEGEGTGNVFWTKDSDPTTDEEITYAMAFEGAPVTSTLTVTPSSASPSKGETSDNDNCYFYGYTLTSGMKTDNVAITAPTNGTITVAYTDTEGVSQSFTSGDADLAHTVILTVSATGDTGYDLDELTINEVAHTSGNTYTCSGATTVAATFTPHVYTITLNKGDHGEANQSATVAYLDDELTSITHVVPSSGYTLYGYYDGDTKVLNADGTFAASNITGYITDGKWTKTSDATLTAKCCANHTVTWKVNGETYTTGTPTTSTNECDGITTMPTNPSAMTCSESFRGWSATNLYGASGQSVPADLFRTADDAPSIDDDKTFYAVFGDAASESATSVTSTFTSKAWADANSLWVSGQDGSEKNATQGVQVTTTTTGANATTKAEYKAVTSVVVTYSTNATTGAGSIEVTVGGTKVSGSAEVTTTGGTEDRTITYTPASALDGKVKFTVNTTTNSIYIKSVQIYHSGSFKNYRCICPSLSVTPKLVTASTPIFITSAAEKTVRSQDSLLIVGSGLQKNATLSISSPASKFALRSRLNGTISTDANGAIDTVAYIYYSPGAGDTSDGLDKNNSFTISDGTNSETVSTALIGRHLPANFVIAAKNGDKWYALPADKTTGTHEPIEITVDDDDDPTTATTSEANVFTLHQQTTTVLNGGNGQYVKLAMHGYSNAPLYGQSSSTGIGKSSGTNIDNDQNADYWWALTQKNTSITNAKDAKYNLSVANGNTSNPVKIWLNASGGPRWGLYSSASNIITEIRLIPWTCTTPSAPTISGETEYTVGETITLTASCATGADAMTSYTWYKGADWATARAADPVQAAAKGSSGYTFTKASCVSGDAGTYWCEASNGTCTAHNSTGYDIDVPLGDDHMLIWEMTFTDGASSLFNTHKEHSTSSYLTTQTTLTTTGMSALGSDGKSDATPKLENSTSEDNSKCAYVTFTVASGYQFVPDSVILSTTAVSNAKNIVVELGSNKQTWAQSKSGSSTPTKHNYTFSSPKACTGTVTLKIHAYASNTDKFRIGSPIKIYGTVEAISGYTVTYEGNGSTGGSVPVDASSPYDAGATVTVLGNTGSLERNGYEFNDWNTTAEGDGTPYKEDDTFTMPGEDVVLYAQWTPNTYTITYNLNGASWASAAGVAEYTVGTGATLPIAENMTNTGYTFGGWYDNSGLTGSAVTTISTSDYGNKTFWAKWTENTYTITYNANGGSGSTTATEGHYVTVANNGFTAPSGKTFVEWNTADDGSGMSYNEGEEVELTADLTLYAIWAKSVGTINWNVTKIDSKLYRGGGNYTITAEIDDASWDASDADSSKLVLTASEGVVLRNIAKSINASGKAQITAKFDITTDVNANATKITFTLTVPENNGYAPLADDHDENLDNCTGGKVEVRFVSSNKNDAGENFADMSTKSNTTQYVGDGLAKLIAIGTANLNDADNKIGYRDDGRLNVVFKFTSATTLDIYFNANATSKSFALYSFSSAKTLSEITTSDYSSKTIVSSGVTAAGATFSSKSHTASTGSASVSSGVVSIGSTKGGLKATYSSLSAGYYVFDAASSSNEGYLFGFDADAGGGGGGAVSPTLTWTPALEDDADWVTDHLAKETGDADFTFTATQNKNSLGTITYASSNTSVATVNATTGKVHIVGAGNATITATMAESGCYNEATADYDITVVDNCDDVAGTVTKEFIDCSTGYRLTVSGHTTTASTSYQWYKDGASLYPAGQAATYETKAAGEYYVIVDNSAAEGEHCPMASTNTVTVESMAVPTATKLLDSVFVKNGRRTPDIALVQTEGADNFQVKSGETEIWNTQTSVTTGFAGCSFYLGTNGIIYLMGQQPDGTEPSGLTAGKETLTFIASSCGGSASDVNIEIHKQAETTYKEIAFVVDGTKNGAWDAVTSGHADGTMLYEYLDSVTVYNESTGERDRLFKLYERNIYKTTDEKTLREHYSQFDAILITDDPNTRTVPDGVKGDDAYKTKGYVNAMGALIDFRPILTMEAFVSALANWKTKGIDGNPTSPNPRQYAMKLDCKNHAIFVGIDPESSNVEVEDIDGVEYWTVAMVDSTKSPYSGIAYNSETDDKPALQGFSASDVSSLMLLGEISGGTLYAGVERQEEAAARLLLLGLNNKALPNALTPEGKKIIENTLKYLIETDMEKVDDCSNYFIGTTSTDWNTASNWSKGIVPNSPYVKARILKPCVLSGVTTKVARVDIATSGKSMHLPSGECSGSLTINPTGALIVGGAVRSAIAPYFNAGDLMPTELGDLTIKASSTDGNGTLIFDNEDGNTQAIVEMYSKAQNIAGEWSWQYVAVPFNDNSSAYRNYYGSWLYRWAENNSGWEVVPDRGAVYPWVGYCLTQASAKLYSMDGTLVATDEQTFTVGNNHDMVIGNSWTAPIQIKQFEDDDFGGLTKNIYLFNTGLDENGTGSTSGERYAAGTYVVIPIHAASYTGDSLISSLQAFTVANTSGDDATLTLNYDKHVRPARSTDKVNAGIMHAPSRREAESNNPVVLKIWASGSHYDDRLVLLERNDFSTGYDAGWDGEKILIGGASPEMYSLMESGKESVTATDDLEGTIIGFRAGEDSEYTFSFSFDENAEPLYLLDLDNTSYTRILNENTYTFQTTDNAEHQRFVLTRNAPEIITGVTNTQGDIPRARKIIYNDKIYILYNGRIFDAQGKVVK